MGSTIVFGRINRGVFFCCEKFPHLYILCLSRNVSIVSRIIGIGGPILKEIWMIERLKNLQHWCWVLKNFSMDELKEDKRWAEWDAVEYCNQVVDLLNYSCCCCLPKIFAGYATKWSKSSTHRFPHSQDVQFLEIQENIIYGYYFIIIFQVSIQLFPKQLHIELEMEDFS